MPYAGLYAGVAWSAGGYDVAVLGADGRPVAGGPARTPVEVVAAVVAAGPVAAVVVDSTNGTVDGRLLEAGLRVYRADPAHLAARPAFGSVPAVALAEAARAGRAALSLVSARGGWLDGRGEEYSAGIAAVTEPCLSHGGRDRARIALTFDDGPCPPYTGRVLEILGRYGVPGTFFCVGLHAAAHPDEVARIVDSGHLVANHSWSHPFLPDLTPAELAGQVERTGEALERAGAPRSPYFRPPYGSRTPEVMRRLGAGGAVVTLWDVEAGDWARPGAGVIARRTLARATAGSIVLLHDGGGDRSQTVEALPVIVESLLGDGYELVTVDRFGA